MADLLGQRKRAFAGSCVTEPRPGIGAYTGEDIDDSSADHCREEARQLLSDVVA